MEDKFKYHCITCSLTFNDKCVASSHISKIKHKKKVEAFYMEDESLSNDEYDNFVDLFRSEDLVSEKDIYYSKMTKINTIDDTKKNIYFCKFCSREFVRKDGLINHLNKTCKVKKDKQIYQKELEKLKVDEDQQIKINFIEQKGNKIKMEEVMVNSEVDNPFNTDNDELENIDFEDNSYGNIGTNNIPPDPNLVNPDNNNYPNELPEIKDQEKEDYEEFQKLMHLASLQGLNEEEQMYFVYQYQRKKRQEELNDIKYYYMMIRREEERQRISNAQKISLFSVNESKRILKKVREQVSTLALLNKNTLRLTEEDFIIQNEQNTKILEDVDTKYSFTEMKTKVLKNKKFRDNNYDLPIEDDVEEMINKSLEPEDYPNKAEELEANKINNKLYENNITLEEELYNEIDNLYKENIKIFNYYIRKNFIKFQHLFEDVL